MDKTGKSRSLAPLVIGGGLAAAGIATMLSRSAQAASPEPEAPTPEEQDMTELEAQLSRLNGNLEKLLTINQLEYNFDQTRYLANKVRAGEGITSRGSTYITCAPGASSGVNFAIPGGYVWVLHDIRFRVSQAVAFDLSVFIDDAITPWIYFPRCVDTDLLLYQILPYDLVVKETAFVTYTNLDALAQWGMVSWLATFVRKDVWERDLAIMNKMAEVYKITEDSV